MTESIHESIQGTARMDREAAAGPDPDRVLARVEALVGAEAVTLEGGTPVVRPDSEGVTADLLRVAGEQGWRVLPRGAGRGPAPFGAPDLEVSTRGMDEVIEYEPGDLVVRARAGVPFGRLQEVVGREGQWLALDPPGGGGVTLGGVTATGAAGPLRVRYGRPRDQLLGLTMVDGGGRILPLGGRVVKNVAGFDLVRLAAGSRGALGVITEVTFRLYPLPEEDRTLVWTRRDAGDAWKLGRDLALLPLPLAAAELLGGEWGPPIADAGADGGKPAFRVLARLGGSPPEVASMRESLARVAGPPSRELEGEGSRRAAEVLSERDGSDPLSVRAHALPDRGRPVAKALGELPGCRFALHLLHGTFRATLDPDSDPEVLRALDGEVRAAGGVLRVSRAPGGGPGGPEVEAEAPRALRSLESRIVDEFDPAGILPGRWGPEAP